MKKIIVLGNFGSGKSTYAEELSRKHEVAHLDLDSLAWLPIEPPQRKPIVAAKDEILNFVAANQGWVIEGCYTDLLDIVSEQASEVVFLNLSKEQCQKNAKIRPWESHKYPSKQVQDDNLPALLDWIAGYYDRKDTFSLQSHLNFYNRYSGKKTMYTSNTRTDTQES